MQFFKHYHNASSSIKLQRLIHEGGKVAYADYWLLLELLCGKFDGDTTKIEVFCKEVATKLQVRSNRVETILELLSNLDLIKFERDGLVFKIDAPILLELKDRDFKKARNTRAMDAPKNKEIRVKNKNKNKDKRDKNKEKKESEKTGAHELLFDNFLASQLETVKIKTQEAWIVTYKNPEWVKTELMKAVTWLVNNNEKRIDMGRFFSNWLSRAYSNHGQVNRRPTISEIAENQIANNPFREVV